MSTIAVEVPSEVGELNHEGYYKRVHTIGRIFSTLMIFANVMPVILVWALYGIFPDLGKVLPALGVVYGILLPFFLTEGWMYYGVLGVAGTYMGWAGNVSNCRLPSASVAQDLMKTKPGSIEAEIVGNIAIGTNLPFSVLFILLGAILGNAVLSSVPAWILSAFSYALPCIFGALIAQFSLKGVRYAIPILVISYLLIILFPTSASWMRVLGMLIVLMPIVWFAYKKFGIFWVADSGGGRD